MRPDFVILSYDIQKYPFQQILASHVFGVKKLDELHLDWLAKTNKTTLEYADNLYLRKIMQDLPDDSVLYKLYKRWVAKVLAPNFAGKISFSNRPKMRVHLANTSSVSNFHRDADVTGKPHQINCYLPFTDVYDTNTIWCEQDYGQTNYAPLCLKYGEALLWDGGMLTHGTFANKTAHTRISCDFRFHPLDPLSLQPPWSDIISNRPALPLQPYQDNYY